MCQTCQRRFAAMEIPTKHHRKERSNGGTDDPANITIVKGKFHNAFHLLFGNKGAIEIAEELNRRWVDPNWVIIARKR